MLHSCLLIQSSMRLALDFMIQETMDQFKISSAECLATRYDRANDAVHASDSRCHSAASASPQPCCLSTKGTHRTLSMHGKRQKRKSLHKNHEMLFIHVSA